METRMDEIPKSITKREEKRTKKKKMLEKSSQFKGQKRRQRKQ